MQLRPKPNPTEFSGRFALTKSIVFELNNLRGETTGTLTETWMLFPLKQRFPTLGHGPSEGHPGQCHWSCTERMSHAMCWELPAVGHGKKNKRLGSTALERPSFCFPGGRQNLGVTTCRVPAQKLLLFVKQVGGFEVDL